jgi:hypothetical protein
MAEPNSPQPPPGLASTRTGLTNTGGAAYARQTADRTGLADTDAAVCGHQTADRTGLADTATDPLTDPLVRLSAARPRRPLPDAVAIRQIAIPHAEPPYDLADDTAALAPTWPDSATRPKATSAGQASDLPHFDERYSAGPWPSQFAQALAETLAGTRPQSQIAPWTSIKARRTIRQLSPVLATASQPKLKRVIITSPAGGVLEMTIVVDLGQRVRALAVRLEHTDSPRQPDPAGPASANPTRRPVIKQARPADPTCSPAPVEPRWRCTAIEAA